MFYIYGDLQGRTGLKSFYVRRNRGKYVLLKTCDFLDVKKKITLKKDFQYNNAGISHDRIQGSYTGGIDSNCELSSAPFKRLYQHWFT